MGIWGFCVPAPGMKQKPSKQTGIRVVDERESDGEVVRLGGEGVVRLGGGSEPVAGRATPQRLEVAKGEGVEARTATVDEILDDTGALESPDVPLEESWGGEAKRWPVVPWGWFVLVTLICVGFAGWSLRHLIENRHVTELAVSRTTELFSDEEQRKEEARVLYQKLKDRATEYLASDTIEERLRHVRHPGRVAPLMSDWYEDHPLKGEKFMELGTFQPLTLDMKPFWVMRVRTDDRRHSLLLEQTEEDEVLVDWETDVCFQPMPWERFVSERPEGEFDFRVEVRPDNFFAYEFSDESSYRCLRLAVRDSREHLFGYVERGSELERRILPLLRRRAWPVPMIVRLRFVPGSAARRSVVISELISERWCLVEDQPD